MWSFEKEIELPPGVFYKPPPPSLKMEREKFKSTGQCIYCFKPFPPDELTDEHIVPKSLRGTLIFSKSVCEACRKITGNQENLVLKEDFLIPRILLNLSYKDLKLPLVAIPNEDPSKEIYDIELSAEDYPKIVSVMTFPLPGLLTGNNYDGGAPSLRMLMLNLERYAPPRKSSMNFATNNPVHMGALLMLMAKVGYSYAIAKLGFNYFDSTDIRDLLLDKRNDVFNFVGSPENTKRISSDLHAIEINELNGYLVASVNLFSSIYMYPYLVVLGKRI